jgi:hypothetical protein
MVVRRSAWQFASALLAAIGFALPATLAAADTLTGTVTDVTTGRPVVGADINVKYLGQTVGSATSGGDGTYQVTFTLPPRVFVTLWTGSPRHDPQSKPVQTGSPLPVTHDIALLPLGLGACVSKADHAFIVGHFPSPAIRDVSELSVRVARTLYFGLRTELGKRNFALKLQPIFPSCEAANPSEVTLGAAFAKALGAHAFITGEVAGNAPEFLMTIYVSDAYELFGGPELGKDIPVNLDRPSEAKMPGQTHVAVLAAMAAGLKKKDDCVSAIAVISIIAELVESIPAYVEQLQKECQARLPHAGLVRAGP